jgi:hypothetical protein
VKGTAKETICAHWPNITNEVIAVAAAERQWRKKTSKTKMPKYKSLAIKKRTRQRQTGTNKRAEESGKTE